VILASTTGPLVMKSTSSRKNGLLAVFAVVLLRGRPVDRAEVELLDREALRLDPPQHLSDRPRRTPFGFAINRVDSVAMVESM
jgi:hypothetical protein